ncbi:glutamate--cysteine ligase [Francisella tularensis subsp. novicida]|uniref:Glutamate--cysteine ligase n=2 Tax=Francisella tularensis TaxID=263 RepID=A0A6I4RP57_FRATU|nr:glutamate--cysteine ligase [Francisella tularensis]ABK89185.1 glutamate-cysteine ligase [Francisella tularensis subsp. novicida U112]AJI61050.1 glutamate--cysteine ligase [Francisella tularensis subsp. novicida U112]EDX19043.1 glutamate--cysteine ligase [Francisella tularensis subsp. novicida FTE]MBK2035160.1 glutamate--cysteine ligase [Francisella tularensis subsp. novicida]MBK2116248.1 glutamate--cysteine ligase [Francisella tularensis subsp. novicida]
MYDFKKINNLRGIERETLRVTDCGNLATSNHPDGLGHKLTNNSITVDFSENLLELITKPHDSIDKAIGELYQLSAFTLDNMHSDEIILNTSMPLSANDNDIQEADFGSSNSGRMKRVYRKGLSARYGKIMQIISGIHYNFSFDKDLISNIATNKQVSISDIYFDVLNNYFEFMWLLPYLFGASPICAKTSVKNKPNYLSVLDDEFYVGEYATSLRMSDLGYTSPAQKDLAISYDNVKAYVKDLIQATDDTFADYKRIGLYNSQGQRIQLNDSILQIENEYYSAIRPKQIAKRGERPACALYNRGVEYVEVRVLDVDPFEPVGISKDTALFVEAMLMTCLEKDAKKYHKDIIKQAKQNLTAVAIHGRNPQLKLKKLDDDSEILLKDYALELFDEIEAVAKKMPKEYLDAVEIQKRKVLDISQTPSAKIIELARQHGYKKFILDISRQVSQQFRSYELPAAIVAKLKDQAGQSVAAEKELIANDKISLDEYINRYYESSKGCC